MKLPLWPRLKHFVTESWIPNSVKHREHWWCDSAKVMRCLELLLWLIIWDFSLSSSLIHNKPSLLGASLIQKLLEFTQVLYWSLIFIPRITAEITNNLNNRKEGVDKKKKDLQVLQKNLFIILCLNVS